MLHFDKAQIPPVRAFWSLTMYDQRQLFAANPIDRYAIGDRDALKFNADGSLDLYIQRESPGTDKAVQLAAGAGQRPVLDEPAAVLAQARGARRPLGAAGTEARRLTDRGRTMTKLQAGFGVLLLVALAGRAGAQAEFPDVVAVDGGPVKGVRDAGVISWKGIAYAGTAGGRAALAHAAAGAGLGRRDGGGRVRPVVPAGRTTCPSRRTA